MTSFLQAVANGLLIGGIYGLVALGLNTIFGTMRVINFAQGALLMVAMFCTYWLWTLWGIHPYLSPFITVPLLFGFGYGIQKTLIRPLLVREKAREPMSALLVTLGLTLMLENTALLFFGADYKTVHPPIARETVKIGDIILSVPRLNGLLVMLAVGIVLYLFFTRTDLGRAIRATGQDREVARLMGVNDYKIYNIAFGLGTALMGITGAFLIPFFYVFPTLGLSFILKAFVIVVLGGLGSMPGAVLGGLLIGLMEGVTGLYLHATVAQIFVFALFVLIIFYKPTGLLGVEER